MHSTVSIVALQKVVEFEESKISLVTLAPELFGREGFKPTSHAAPYTAISRYAGGELLVIAIPAESGWFYRIDYPYYSWAETVVRPTIQRRELSGVSDRCIQIFRLVP